MRLIDSVGRQERWQIEIVVLPLWMQTGLPIVPTVVQDGLEEGFVMIMIRLGFQEHTIDVDGQLFDHGMCQIGHGIQDRVVRQIGGRAGLQLDFHFKITSIQIQEGFGGRDQKFHRIDPRGHGSQLSKPDPQRGRVRLGDLEHLQFWAHDPRR